MIYDRLDNCEQYYSLHKDFKMAFDFLRKIDLVNLENGKYNLEGTNIYANVQTLTTKPIEEKKGEAHRKCIDIQYVIKGREKMGYGTLEDFKDVFIPYDKEKDIEFLNGEKFNFVDVEAGNFVIFYPNDVHAPMLAVNEPAEIKKVIVKICI